MYEKRDADMKYHGLYKEDIEGKNLEETVASTMFKTSLVVFSPSLILILGVVTAYITQ